MAGNSTVPAVERFKYSQRVVLRSILNRHDGGKELSGHRVVTGGWVKSRKDRPEVAHDPSAAVPLQAEDASCIEALLQHLPLLRPLVRILLGRLSAATATEAKPNAGPVTALLRINDGSTSSNLQVVMDSSMSLPGQVIHVGACILVEGVLQNASAPKGHAVELKAERILHIGIADSQQYPLAKPKFSLEFLRTLPHLRPRSVTVGSIARIRGAVTLASHEFFKKNGFIHVHMPILNSTDTSYELGLREANRLDTVKSAIREKSKRIKEMPRSDSNKETLLVAEQDLEKTKELAVLLEKSQRDLTVSAGLHLESYACALSSVYTIGPVFRADEPRAKRLTEMWMVEVELAFAELEDAMNCAEDYLKFLCQSLVDTSGSDLKYVSKTKDKECTERIRALVSSSFERITYSQALEIVDKVKDRTFRDKVSWGESLSEEHERYLVDDIFKKAVIVYEHPKELKPFYARVRDDGRTTSTFDIIVPKIGVLLRGSQKEERLDVLNKRIGDLGLSSERLYDWYKDLRRYGSVKHSGFGLDLEKMMLFATGLTDLRDVIPFPRTCDRSSEW
ncbi:asparagine--tRNA ligase, cytoplasmic 2-like [Zingiber officinale]|uniref:asparagine--tRNA ligase, cytoplasmic 2-like n=1 Tax=Zingiber officinale TaxID=94328 RepID=UPI001C4C005C|nr:asparagine--tRNA ligase, cytoplasmic 2-like [Zingiber officinale]